MGIDFLDINFRIKKRLGYVVHWEDYPTLLELPKGHEFTVGDLFEAHRRALDRFRNQTNAIPTNACTSSASSLTGDVPPPLRNTPTGSRWNVSDDDLWAIIKEATVESLHVDPDEVHPSARLVRDLGMS